MAHGFNEGGCKRMKQCEQICPRIYADSLEKDECQNGGVKCKDRFQILDMKSQGKNSKINLGSNKSPTMGQNSQIDCVSMKNLNNLSEKMMEKQMELIETKI